MDRKEADFTRRLTVERQEENGNDYFSISSDTPIWSDYHGEYQTLLHTEEAIDLETFRGAGIPFLRDHDDWDIDEQVAVLEDPRIVDGKLRCRVGGWRTHQKATEIKTDWESKVIRNVSVRFRTLEFRQIENYNNKPQVLITKWLPREASVVSIPADDNVGQLRKNQSDLILEIKDNTKSMSEENTNKEYQERIEQARKEGQEEFVRKMNFLDEMSDQHDLPKDVVRKLRSEKAGESEVQRAVIETITKRSKERKNEVTGNPEPVAGIKSETYDVERSRYSLGEAIRAAYTGDFSSREAGLAREVSKELSQGVELGRRSLMIPLNELADPSLKDSKRAGLTDAAITDSYIETSDFITTLRASTVMGQLGARMYTGLMGNVRIGKMAQGANVAWGNVGAQISTTDTTTTQVELSAKKVRGLVQLDNDTVLQTPYVAEQILREDLRQALMVGIETALFSAQQQTNAIRAINAYPAINALGATGNANGTVLSYDDMIDLVGAVGAANGIMNPSSTGFVVPWVGRTRLFKLKDNNNFPLIVSYGDQISDTAMGRLTMLSIGERLATSNNLSTGLTRGTNSDAYHIYYADFSQLVMGYWGTGIQIDVGTDGNDFSFDRVSIRGVGTVDAQPRYEQSFGAYRFRRP